MIRAGLVKVLALGLCISALWTGAAYARLDSGYSSAGGRIQAEESKLYEKQRELDQYLFEGDDEFTVQIESFEEKETDTAITETDGKLPETEETGSAEDDMETKFTATNGEEVNITSENDDAGIKNPSITAGGYALAGGIIVLCGAALYLRKKKNA